MLRNKFGKKFNSNQDDVNFSCTIRFLDDSEPLSVTFQKDTCGQYLFDHVCCQLDLLESDCFGLRYVDSQNQRHWLDMTKKIYRQLKHVSPMVLCFRVKFYPTEPMKLKEEITRYFVFLQLRRDLHHGRLLCPQADANVLAAYIVQSEIGDFDSDAHVIDYVSHFKMLPKQTQRQEDRIAELHSRLVGLTPAEAEAKFLMKASQFDTYGVDPHPAKDQNGNQMYLGVTHHGIVTFQGSKKTRVFKWTQITKITFEGRMFIVHVTIGEKKNAWGFKCPTLAACKHLWKSAVEQRYFYTMLSSSEIPKVTSGGGLFSRATRFRFSGRCEHEALLDYANISRDQPRFNRSSSNLHFVRTYKNMHSSVPAAFNALGLSEGSLDCLTNLLDGQSRSLDDLSILSTPRHHTTLVDQLSQELLFQHHNRTRGGTGPAHFPRLDDDRSVLSLDAAAYAADTWGPPPLSEILPDTIPISDRSMQESNAINARLFEQQQQNAKSFATGSGETRMTTVADKPQNGFIRSQLATFSSRRCAICCWALILAVGMVFSIVFVIAMLILESDVDLPLISDIRRLPEVYRFRHKDYEAFRRRIFGRELDD